jgi:hypothetical protein
MNLTLSVFSDILTVGNFDVDARLWTRKRWRQLRNYKLDRFLTECIIEFLLNIFGGLCRDYEGRFPAAPAFDENGLWAFLFY